MAGRPPLIKKMYSASLTRTILTRTHDTGSALKPEPLVPPQEVTRLVRNTLHTGEMETSKERLR